MRATSRGGPVVAVLAALALAFVAACGGSEQGAASPVPATSVDLPKSYRFAPAEIIVRTGATVTWTNNDNFTHNVTLDGEDALTMAPGETAAHTFAAPGTYAYVCTLHPRDMTGTVVVTDG